MVVGFKHSKLYTRVGLPCEWCAICRRFDGWQNVFKNVFLSYQTSLFCFQENNCSVLLEVLKAVEYYQPDVRVIALLFMCSASIIQFSSLSAVLHKFCVVVGQISLKWCYFGRRWAILSLGDTDSSRRVANGVPVWPNQIFSSASILKWNFTF